MLEICSIASGSNGNCYYIGNHHDAILVDAGISAKQIIGRIEEKGLDAGKVSAVFITHEHSDHMRGARVLAKKLQVPVYLSVRTFDKAYKNMRPEHPRLFAGSEGIEVGDFTVYPVSKRHDAADPYSFRIRYKDKNVGVFTDIGHACDNVLSHVQKCDGLFLEANYDEDMLWNGAYPYFLKKRVASDLGHLSNQQAFDILDKYAAPSLKFVLFSHISKDNNSPEKVKEKMTPLSGKFEWMVSSRFMAGDVLSL